MNVLSATNRSQIISKLQSEVFDLVIIGGGITGAGIALDAASRGLKVALVEKDDFASGTSSRSTKLIHGGLRYLKQFEIMLVREVGRERAIVHKLAPHLVTSEKMLLPLIKDGTFGKFMTSLGLMVYDVLAGVEKVDQRIMLSKEETIEKEPLLKEDIIEGGGLYAEYRTDDARLTIEIIKTAAKYGATSINYVKATDFEYDDKGKVCGIKCEDIQDASSFSIRSKYVISAAGPWVDKLRKINNSLEGKHLFLSKGVHLVVPHERFPVNQSVYFDVSDGRMIFAIPRNRVTYIGTTDTPYSGDINHITTNQEDANYLIDAVNNIFPGVHLKMEDVVSSWAGLRPLIFEEGKSASAISRKDEIFESENGLLSIAGGKLTGYRIMAEKIVDIVARKILADQHLDLIDCFTDKIPLNGGPFSTPEEVQFYEKDLYQRIKGFNLDKHDAHYLVANYGKQSDDIFEKFKELDEVHPRIRLARAELWYGVHHELVADSMDFFARRTGRLYFEIQSIQPVMDVVLNDLKNYLNWSDKKVEQEKVQLNQAIYEAHNFESNKEQV
ncbi:MAG: glycerol-3-phosphate dehydrogenase [Saprospiraceae bacterium]|jgi:glycerol-3-phosphate dehydrogenase